MILDGHTCWTGISRVVLGALDATLAAFAAGQELRALFSVAAGQESRALFSVPYVLDRNRAWDAFPGFICFTHSPEGG